MATTTLPETDVAQQDVEKTREDNGTPVQGSGSDTDDSAKRSGEQELSWNWDTDPHNPYNWSSEEKALQVVIISSIAFLA